MTQQELGQAMSRAQDVLALVLTGPQQVTHGLLGRQHRLQLDKLHWGREEGIAQWTLQLNEISRQRTVAERERSLKAN